MEDLGSESPPFRILWTQRIPKRLKIHQAFFKVPIFFRWWGGTLTFSTYPAYISFFSYLHVRYLKFLVKNESFPPYTHWKWCQMAPKTPHTGSYRVRMVCVGNAPSGSPGCFEGSFSPWLLGLFGGIQRNKQHIYGNSHEDTQTTGFCRCFFCCKDSGCIFDALLSRFSRY